MLQQQNQKTSSLIDTYVAKIFHFPEYESPRAAFLCPKCEEYHLHSTESGTRSPCGHCRDVTNEEEYYLDVQGEATEQDYLAYNNWKFNKKKQNIADWFWPYSYDIPTENEGRIEAIEHGKKLLKSFCEEYELDYAKTLEECINMNKKLTPEEEYKKAVIENAKPKEIETLPEKKEVDWSFLTNSEEELSEMDENDIKECLNKLKQDPSQLKVQPLDMISIYGNKIIKTIVRVEELEKGSNMRKGIEVTCPACHDKRTIYNPSIKTTEETCGCANISSRGKETFEKLQRKVVNDTGYECEIIDPNSKSNTTPHKMFISLNLLPKSQSEIDLFDRKLFTSEIEITGIVRIYPTNDKFRSGWFIDVTGYKFLEKVYHYDVNEIKKLNDKIRDDVFFKDYYAPTVHGAILRKKILALAIASPIETRFPDGTINNSFVRALFAGDPGEAKTVLSKRGFIDYSEGRSVFLSVENATTKGLIVRTSKGSNGRWKASMGEMPKYHGGGCVLDGYGRMNQEQQAELRGIKEEGIAQSIKASGNIKMPCKLHTISLGNLKKRVEEYPTKHQASFNIAINHQDVDGKYAGAERRRDDFVVIISSTDLETTDVQRSVLIKDKTKDFDDIKFWNNLNAFAWSRKPESVEWEEGIEEQCLCKLKDLNETYKNFESDYGVLGKGGSQIFMKLLPGVAILNGSIRDETVVVKKEHADWLYNLYIEMFNDLGLNNEQEQQEYFDAHAEMIYALSNKEQKEVLHLLTQYGSQSAIEKTSKMSRKTIYNRLRPVVSYSLWFELDNGQKEQKNYLYSFHDGSVRQVNNAYSVNYENTNELEPLMKNDGSFTLFGKRLLKKAKNGFSKLPKIVKEVQNE